MVTDASPAAAPGFWQRRIVTPIANQFRQGITPDKIALTLAIGIVCSLFPILGATTILCSLAALLLRLNQPIIQLVNYLAYPLQLALLIPFYRAGETLFGRPHVPLSISFLIERFRADVGQFLRDFGLIAVQGIVVWCLVAPIGIAAVYFLSRPPLRVLARRTAAR